MNISQTECFEHGPESVIETVFGLFPSPSPRPYPPHAPLMPPVAP